MVVDGPVDREEVLRVRTAIRVMGIRCPYSHHNLHDDSTLIFGIGEGGVGPTLVTTLTGTQAEALCAMIRTEPVTMNYGVAKIDYRKLNGRITNARTNSDTI